jgi:hypothetical protein
MGSTEKATDAFSARTTPWTARVVVVDVGCGGLAYSADAALLHEKPVKIFRRDVVPMF